MLLAGFIGGTLAFAIHRTAGHRVPDVWLSCAVRARHILMARPGRAAVRAHLGPWCLIHMGNLRDLRDDRGPGDAHHRYAERLARDESHVASSTRVFARVGLILRCRRNLLVAVAVGAGSLIVLNYLR